MMGLGEQDPPLKTNLDNILVVFDPRDAKQL